jgi:hypothetical protein
MSKSIFSWKDLSCLFVSLTQLKTRVVQSVFMGMKVLFVIGMTIVIAIAGGFAIFAGFKMILIGDLVIFKVVLWMGTPIMGIAYFIKWFNEYSDSINGKVKRYQSKYLSRWPSALSYISIGPLGAIFILVNQRLKGVLIGDQYINIILFLIMIGIAVMMIIDSEWFARLIDNICGRVEQLFDVFLAGNSSTATDRSTDPSPLQARTWEKRGQSPSKRDSYVMKSGGCFHGHGAGKRYYSTSKSVSSSPEPPHGASPFSHAVMEGKDGGNKVKVNIKGSVKGYLGYSKIFLLMYFKDIDINNIERLLIDKIKQYLNTLEDKKVYTILPILKSRVGHNKTMSSSIKISKGTDPVLLAERLLWDKMNIQALYSSEYDDEDDDVILYLMTKVWLSEDEYKGDIEKVSKVLDEEVKKGKRGVKVKSGNIENIKVLKKWQYI